MNTVKKITLATATFFIMTFGLLSCKNRESTSQAPKTAAEARELAASRIWSETPDTMFLDYHWGMSEKEVKAMTARLVKEKRLHRETYAPGYHSYKYTMTLPELGDIIYNVNFDYRNDSLFTIILSMDRLESRDIPMDKLVEGFSSILIDKGYTFFEDVCHPLLKLPSYDFFRGNTSVTIIDVLAQKSIIFLNEYTEAAIQREKADKEMEEMKKALKEIKQKSNSTRNDF